MASLVALEGGGRETCAKTDVLLFFELFCRLQENRCIGTWDAAVWLSEMNGARRTSSDLSYPSFEAVKFGRNFKLFRYVSFQSTKLAPNCFSMISGENRLEHSSSCFSFSPSRLVARGAE